VRNTLIKCGPTRASVFFSRFALNADEVVSQQEGTSDAIRRSSPFNKTVGLLIDKGKRNPSVLKYMVTSKGLNQIVEQVLNF
jgi:hypothetical protein